MKYLFMAILVTAASNVINIGYAINWAGATARQVPNIKHDSTPKPRPTGPTPHRLPPIDIPNGGGGTVRGGGPRFHTAPNKEKRNSGKELNLEKANEQKLEKMKALQKESAKHVRE